MLGMKKELSPPVRTRLPHGRQSKYNAERHKKIVKAVRKGNSLATAGRLAGLGKDTINDWLVHGRKHQEQYPEFAKLVADIEQAQAEREAEHVAKIERAALADGPKDWQAAAWMLERKNPQDWGRKDKVQVEAPKPLVQVNQVILGDEDVRADARSLLRRGTAGHVVTHQPERVGVRSESEDSS